MIVVGRPALASPPSSEPLLRFFDLENGRILIDGEDIAPVTAASASASPLRA